MSIAIKERESSVFSGKSIMIKVAEILMVIIASMFMCTEYSAIGAELSIQCQNGYGLLAVPFDISQGSLEITQGDENPVCFKYLNGVYESCEISLLEFGDMVWLYVDQDTQLDLEGSLEGLENTSPITLKPGWNLVASLSNNSVQWSDRIVEGGEDDFSSVYRYDTETTSYETVEELEPGEAYFVKYNGDNDVTLAWVSEVAMAYAGEDFSAQVGATVTLNCGGSSPLGQEALVCAWSQVSGPDVLIDPQEQNPSFIPSETGEYVFSLTVADGLTVSEPDQVTVTIIQGGGQTIVFNTVVDVGNRRIVAMNPDGTGGIDLTDGTYDDFAPQWSADGTKISFCSKRAGDSNYAFYIMNADGGGQTKLIEIPNEDCDSVDWSEDGSMLVLGTYTLIFDPLSTTYGVYTINIDGTGLTQLSSSTMSGIWNVDGTKVLFTDFENQRISAINPDGTGSESFLDFDALYPVEISADDSKLLVVGLRIPAENIVNADEEKNGLFWINADGTGDFTLIFETEPPSAPLYDQYAYYCDPSCSWSPDGTQIVYDKRTNLEQGNVCVSNIDGSDETLVSDQAVYSDWKKN